MKRFDVLKKLIEIIDDQIVICNLETSSKELYHLKDRPENLYMFDSMGLASSIALGVAIAKPDKIVWCIDTDGSILINLGSLSTISYINPMNLTLIVIDIGIYDKSAIQETHTNHNTKLDFIARGSGIDLITVIRNREDIVPTFKELGKGCQFVLIQADPGDADVPNIPLSPKVIKKRFVQYLSKDN